MVKSREGTRRGSKPDVESPSATLDLVVGVVKAISPSFLVCFAVSLESLVACTSSGFFSPAFSPTGWCSSFIGSGHEGTREVLTPTDGSGLGGPGVIGEGRFSRSGEGDGIDEGWGVGRVTLRSEHALVSSSTPPPLLLLLPAGMAVPLGMGDKGKPCGMIGLPTSGSARGVRCFPVNKNAKEMEVVPPLGLGLLPVPCTVRAEEPASAVVSGVTDGGAPGEDPALPAMGPPQPIWIGSTLVVVTGIGKVDRGVLLSCRGREGEGGMGPPGCRRGEEAAVAVVEDVRRGRGGTGVVIMRMAVGNKGATPTPVVPREGEGGDGAVVNEEKLSLGCNLESDKISLVLIARFPHSVVPGHPPMIPIAA